VNGGHKSADDSQGQPGSRGGDRVCHPEDWRLAFNWLAATEGLVRPTCPAALGPKPPKTTTHLLISIIAGVIVAQKRHTSPQNRKVPTAQRSWMPKMALNTWQMSLPFWAATFVRCVTPFPFPFRFISVSPASFHLCLLCRTCTPMRHTPF